MKKVISMVLAVLMLLSLAACGGKAPDTVKDGYPGTWIIDHLTIDGVTYAQSELEALGDYRSQALLVIKEGGQAYAAESGLNGVIIAWSETENGILLDDDEVIMEDGLLRLEVYDDELWYFRKVSDSQLIEKPTEPVSTESPVETAAPESEDAEPTAPEVAFSADAEPVDGEVYVSEGFEFVHYTDGSIALTKYIGSDTSVDIYQEIAGYPVSRIGAGAFESCAFVESIYLWAKVIEIGEGAFRNCTKLESFDVPSSVTIIADSTFENCTSLENIYIWGKVTSIGSSAFRNCAALESVDIPSSCNSIGESAFEGCTSLETVYFWGQNVTCGTAAFADCPNLKELPKGIVYAKGASSEKPEASEPVDETDAELVDGMRPEFKEAMDAYEAFYDEYCDFMIRYQDNPTDLMLVAQYGQLLIKMAEVNEAFEKWDESELNNEELKYYLEVSSRVMQKLVDVTG